MTVSSKYYITESPWLISIQIGWEEQIYNTALPYWFRVFAVAMARSEPNLHTELQTGELAKLLGKKQPDGSIKPVDRRDLNGYIKGAINRKLLDETSGVRCLVLPAATTACRRQGSRKGCGYHSGEASKVKKPIAIKRTIPGPINRVNSDDTSPQVTSPPVGRTTRRRRVEVTPTPGSRDILAVKPRPADGVLV